MSILFLKDSNNNGFALVELAVVMSIIGIFSAIGIPLYTQARDNAIIEGAKQVLFSMKKNCESNYAWGIPSDFSQLRIKNYTISPSSNNCSLISAVANDNKNFPSFTYDMNEGTFSCFFKEKEATPFPDCKKINSKESAAEKESRRKAQERADLVAQIQAEEEAATLEKAKAEAEALAKQEAEKALAKQEAKEAKSLQAFQDAKDKRDNALKFEDLSKTVDSNCGTKDELKKSEMGMLNMRGFESMIWNTLGQRNRGQITNRSSNAIAGYRQKIQFMKDCRQAYPNLLYSKINKEYEVANMQRQLDRVLRDEEKILKQRAEARANDPCSSENRKSWKKLSLSRRSILSKRCGTSQLRIELNPSVKATWALNKSVKEFDNIKSSISRFEGEKYLSWEKMIKENEMKARQFLAESKN